MAILDPQQLNIQRKIQLANALREQSMQSNPTQFAPGGLAIQQSPLEGMSRLAQAYASNKIGQQADNQAQQAQTATNQDVPDFLSALQGHPADAPADGVGPVLPAQAPDRQKALAIALQSQNPMVQQLGTSMVEQSIKPHTGININGQLVDPQSGELIGKAIPKQDEITPYQQQMLALEHQKLKIQQQAANPLGNMGAGAANPQVHGDAVLQNMNPQIAAQVKALAEGRMAFPAGFALKSPYWQQMISAVSQYDPSFDAVNYQSRSQTRNDFTKGKSADNMTALNTAIQHLGKLSDSFSELNNGSFPAVNAAENWLGNTLGNKNIQGNYAAVSANATAVAHELAKVFRQTGMSEGEIKDWETKISPNASPEQMKSTIQSALGLMEGRLQALGARYNQGMGTTAHPLDLLTPEAKQTYTKLAGTQAPEVAPAPAAGGAKFLGFE